MLERVINMLQCVESVILKYKYVGIQYIDIKILIEIYDVVDLHSISLSYSTEPVHHNKNLTI